MVARHYSGHGNVPLKNQTALLIKVGGGGVRVLGAPVNLPSQAGENSSAVICSFIDEFLVICLEVGKCHQIFIRISLLPSFDPEPEARAPDP